MNVNKNDKLVAFARDNLFSTAFLKERYEHVIDYVKMV